MSSFMVNINCQSFERGGYCTDKKTKRCLLGIGPRLCKDYDYPFSDKCDYRKEYPRPILTPMHLPKGGSGKSNKPLNKIVIEIHNE